MNGKELTQQIRKAFGMKSARQKNSKRYHDLIVTLLPTYVRRSEIDFRAMEMMYGIQWAFNTGRLNVNAEWAIRHMNAYKFSALIGLVSDNCETQNDIPRWINQNEEKVTSL